MPIYLSKKQNFQIPSGTVTEQGANAAEIEDSNFLNDPEEHRDELPQPFRLINKLVTSLFDDSWEVITSRAEEQQAEQARVLPPKSDMPLAVQGSYVANATALKDTKDGKYIIVGLRNGLALLDAVTLAAVDLWEHPAFDLVPPLKVEVLGANCHLVAARDDMGGARLFAVYDGRLYLLRTLYEGSGQSKTAGNADDSKGGSKPIVHQLDLARDADFCAVTVELVKTSTTGPGNNTDQSAPISRDVFVELYRIPRDQWLKELEVLHSSHKKLNESENPGGANIRSQQKEVDQDDSISQPGREGIREEDNNSRPKTGSGKLATTMSRETSALFNTSSVSRESTNLSMKHPRVGSKKRKSKKMGSLGEERSSPKFAAPLLCLKCRPVSRRVTPVSGSAGTATVLAPNQMVKMVNTQCEVFGIGNTHLYTHHNMQQRRDLFEQGRQHARQLYETHLASYTLGEPLILPTVIFLKDGPLLPPGLEDQASGLAIWWEGDNHVKFHSLAKAQTMTSSATKDVEQKTDVLWTFASSITATTLSPCGSLLAVGLHSGVVLVADYACGVQRSLQRVSQDPIVMLDFLLPTQKACTAGSCLSAQLLVVDSQWKYFLQDCGQAVGDTCPPPHQVKSSVKYPFEETVWMQYASHNLPSMVVRVTQLGRVVLHDLSHQREVLEFRLPAPYTLWQPWQPCLCLAGMGQTLCLKVNTASSDSVSTEDNLETKLLFFPLRHMRLLAQYWSSTEGEVTASDSTRLSTRCLVEQRASLFLRDRHTKFVQRQELLQKSWAGAKLTFAALLKEREAMQKKVATA